MFFVYMLYCRTSENDNSENPLTTPCHDKRTGLDGRVSRGDDAQKDRFSSKHDIMFTWYSREII